jgi:TPR repeat protein
VRTTLSFIRAFSISFLLLLLLSVPHSAFAASFQDTQRILAPSLSVPPSPPSPEVAAQYQRAYSLLFNPHSTPDYTSALPLLRFSASQHFAPAEFLLGYLYDHGQGVPLDYAQAVEHYRAAASLGHGGAENNLGGLYQYGRGVPKDIHLAFQHYRAAAEHGNVMGEYNLATFYHLGYATPPDVVEAAKWFRAAADQGLASAQANLALFYFKGTGVPIDYAQSAHYSRLAAEQGLPHAAINYAYLCEHGMGVPRDYVAAYLWYSRAVARGDKSGASPLKSVAHHLSREQLQQANTQLAADASHSQPPDASSASGDITLFEHP